MATITLEAPDELASRWEQLPVNQRDIHMLVALFDDYESNENPAPLPPLTAEDLASIGRGLAQADAGEGVDGAEFFARLRERIRQ